MLRKLRITGEITDKRYGDLFRLVIAELQRIGCTPITLRLDISCETTVETADTRYRMMREGCNALHLKLESEVVTEDYARSGK